MMPALCSPKAISTTLRASRIVADAHRDGLVRHVLLAEKVAGRVAPRDRIERHQPRAAVPRRERLVEADVAVAADAQHLHVDAAGPANRLLRSAGNSRSPASGGTVPSGMWMFSRRDVDVVEKVSSIQRW